MAESKSVIASGTTLIASVSLISGVATGLSPLPPEHYFYPIIGRVAAEWARLEHILDLIIWELSGIDHKTGSCLTSQLTGQYARFNVIQALAASRNFEKKMLSRIEYLSNKASTIAKRRNRFVHDAWYTEGGEHAGQFKSFSAKDGQFGIYEVTENYAKETIDLIRKMTSEIDDLRTSIQELILWTPRKIAVIHQRPRNCLRMIRVRSLFDS